MLLEHNHIDGKGRMVIFHQLQLELILIFSLFSTLSQNLPVNTNVWLAMTMEAMFLIMQLLLLLVSKLVFVHNMSMASYNTDIVIMKVRGFQFQNITNISANILLSDSLTVLIRHIGKPKNVYRDQS